MISETPEQDGAPIRGWVFYDSECALCVRGVRRWGEVFARRGFQWLPLQSPGTTGRLQLSEAERRREMKLLLAGGRVVGGVDAWAELFRAVWWLWPLGMLLRLPGFHTMGCYSYRVIARNRHCLGGRCALQSPNSAHHRHTAFLELP